MPTVARRAKVGSRHLFFMSKLFIRIVALLLVSCLVADPVTVSGFSNSLSSTWERSPRRPGVACPPAPQWRGLRGVVTSQQSLFEQQALSIPETWARNAGQRSAFRERRLIGHFSVLAATSPLAWTVRMTTGVTFILQVLSGILMADLVSRWMLQKRLRLQETRAPGSEFSAADQKEQRLLTGLSAVIASMGGFALSGLVMDYFSRKYNP